MGYGRGEILLLLLKDGATPADTPPMSAVGTVDRADAIGPDFATVLAAAQAGGAWALRRIYDGLAPAVAGYARAQGATDADELVNDVFARAFRRIEGFTGDEPALRSWIFTIAHNALIDDRRRRSRRVVSARSLEAGDVTEATASAEETVLEDFAVARVRAILATLPPDQCEVLTLRLLGDLTIPQVAQILGRSVGATKALQRRGLARLRTVVAQGVPL